MLRRFGGPDALWRAHGYPIGTSMIEPGNPSSPLPIRRQDSTLRTIYLQTTQAIS